MKYLGLAWASATFMVLVFRAAAAAEPPRLKPINLGRVNTSADEVDPHVTADGYSLYYASNAAKKFQIMRATRRDLRGPWSVGKLVEEMEADSDERSPCLSADRKWLYFATNRMAPDLNDQKTKGNFDIYAAVKNIPGPQSAYSSPTPVHKACTEEDELHPWLTAGGDELFFSRKTKDGWRIGVVTRPNGRGAWSDATLLDLPVGFHHPTVTRRGLRMYLQGPLEKGRWGIFRSDRTSLKAKWGKPEQLAGLDDLDATTGDQSPSLSYDEAILYFSSDRPGGKGGLDLWLIPTLLLKTK